MPRSAGETQVISVRLDPVFLTGIDMIVDRQSEGSFLAATRTDVVREALSLIFKKYDISREDINARLYEVVKAEKES